MCFEVPRSHNFNPSLTLFISTFVQLQMLCTFLSQLMCFRVPKLLHFNLGLTLLIYQLPTLPLQQICFKSLFNSILLLVLPPKGFIGLTNSYKSKKPPKKSIIKPLSLNVMLLTWLSSTELSLSATILPKCS